MRVTLAIGLALALVQPALAAEQVSGEPCLASDSMGLTARDQYRISHLSASRTQGLAEALRAGNSKDRGDVSALFADGLAPLSEVKQGKYQCRTIKLGGNLPLVVYQWFSCEISQEDGALTLRKLTGSQNFFGTLVPAGPGYLYKGALHYGYEREVTLYGTTKDRDQVGCLVNASANGSRLVLELPMPVFESQHDVIELRRSTE